MTDKPNNPDEPKYGGVLGKTRIWPKPQDVANAEYDAFIRCGLAAGFTDSQIDFLWDFLGEWLSLAREQKHE